MSNKVRRRPRRSKWKQKLQSHITNHQHIAALIITDLVFRAASASNYPALIPSTSHSHPTSMLSLFAELQTSWEAGERKLTNRSWPPSRWIESHKRMLCELSLISFSFKIFAQETWSVNHVLMSCQSVKFKPNIYFVQCNKILSWNRLLLLGKRPLLPHSV